MLSFQLGPTNYIANCANYMANWASSKWFLSLYVTSYLFDAWIQEGANSYIIRYTYEVFDLIQRSIFS